MRYQRILSTIAGALAFLVLLAASMLPLPILGNTAIGPSDEQPTSAPPDPDCREKLDVLAAQMTPTLDSEKARSIANSNSSFAQKVDGLDSDFYQLSTTWTYDLETCTSELAGVHLHYSLKDGTEAVTLLLVNMDSGVSKVTSIEEHQANVTFDSTIWNTVAAGYSLSPAPRVYVTNLEINVPGIFQRELLTNCVVLACSASIWTGLTDTNGHLVQGGSYSRMVCQPACFSEENAFYEFTGHEQGFAPGSLQVNAGANIIVTVIDHAYWFGGSPDVFNVSIYNPGIGMFWNIANEHYTTGDASFAQYIVERPKFGGLGLRETIGWFTTPIIFMNILLYYDNTSDGVHNPGPHPIPPDSGMEDQKHIMRNCFNPNRDNLRTSNINYPSQGVPYFDVMWLTSCGT
jgi:hypothetical protein